MVPSTHSSGSLPSAEAAARRRVQLFSPDFPLSPRRFPFFYGWMIVVVSTLGILASIPGQTMGVSVFTNHLLNATGLSRLQLSNAYLLGTVFSGLSLPIGGSLLDRFGARTMAMFASGGLALSLWLLSHCDHAIAFLASHGFGTSVVWLGIAFMTFAFFCLRLSGQGMLTMVSRTMLGKWFDKRRGFAAGTAGVFVSFGFASAPLVLNVWVTSSGWRGAWQQMALWIGIVMTLLVWTFFRDNPEQCGLVMDGERSAEPLDVKKGTTPSLTQPSLEFNRAQAVRTLAFWALTLAVALQALIVTGVTFHIIDLGASVHLSASDSVALFLPMAAVSVATNFLSGYLSDRVPIRFLVVLLCSLQCLGCVGALNIAGLWTKLALIVGLGAGGGLFSVLTAVGLPKFFGRRHLGSIAGFQMMCIVLGSALGPSLFAWSKSQTASYATALAALGLVPLAVMVLAWVSRNPSIENRAEN